MIRWWWARLRRLTIMGLASTLVQHPIVLRHPKGVVCGCHQVFVNDAAWALHVAERQVAD